MLASPLLWKSQSTVQKGSSAQSTN